VPVLNVQLITPDDGERNWPKHAEFCTGINLEISASVGCIVKKVIGRAAVRKGSHLKVIYIYIVLFLFNFNSPFRLIGCRCDEKVATAINKPPLRSQHTAAQGLLVNGSNSASDIAFYCTGWMSCD
jgi:hypothetical protein